jgi:hypothetical protein
VTLSTAAVNQVVQPRLLAPATTNDSIYYKHFSLSALCQIISSMVQKPKLEHTNIMSNPRYMNLQITLFAESSCNIISTQKF